MSKSGVSKSAIKFFERGVGAGRRHFLLYDLEPLAFSREQGVREETPGSNGVITGVEPKKACAGESSATLQLSHSKGNCWFSDRQVPNWG